MIDNYDTVKAVKPLSCKVGKDTIGAVLMVYYTNDSLAGYEVEFVDEAGESLEVLTVNIDDIKKV